MNEPSGKAEFFHQRFLWPVAALTVLCWALLFPVHRPANIDDAWTASYVWNLIKLRSADDLVMGNAISNIKYFGHIHAYITSFLADRFGWTHAVFHGFNLLCLLLAAPAWHLVGRKLLHCASLSLWFVLLLYLTGAFIGCAYVARSDAFAFLLVSWGTYCASADRFFPAALLCSLAVETHAIAAAGYFYLLAFFIVFAQKTAKAPAKNRLFPLTRRDTGLLAGKIAGILAGVLVGFAVYRLLHPEPLSEIVAYLTQSNYGSHRPTLNALTAHYFQRAYIRFLPELLFLTVGGLLFFRHRRGRDVPRCAPALLCIAALLASLVIRRPNFHYVPFLYPPLFLVAVAGYARAKIFPRAALVFVAYCVILALALAFVNRHIDRAAFDREIVRAVPRDGRAIIGPSNAWFALRERFFYVSHAAWKKAGHSDKKVYFIDSRYTEPLPKCALKVDPVGLPLEFNASPARIFLVDLSLCEPSRQ